MKLKEISIRDIVEGYSDNGDDGVVAYDGVLDVRPAYQREFVYDGKKREAVIHSIMSKFPINVMYWFKNGDRYEILDGQQRTISICQFINHDFAIKIDKTTFEFGNLTDVERDQILDYKLLIYMCEGTDKQKLDWFETINIAGEKLTPQELLNAIDTGPWLTDAKRHFSKRGGPAYGIGSDLMKGDAIRQAYLETAMKWINAGDVSGYMAKNQFKNNAKELWLYYNSVIAWVRSTFTYRKEMKGLAWGEFYNKYKDVEVDPSEVTRLMLDEEIKKKSGIYEFLLSGEEKHLSLRAFDDKQKREAFERQKGVCPITEKVFEDYNQMHADHIIPWSKGGKTTSENCQMLDPRANLIKSDS